MEVSLGLAARSVVSDSLVFADKMPSGLHELKTGTHECIDTLNFQPLVGEADEKVLLGGKLGAVVNSTTSLGLLGIGLAQFSITNGTGSMHYEVVVGYLQRRWINSQSFQLSCSAKTQCMWLSIWCLP